MKFSYTLPFVVASSAFVLPPEEVLNELTIEDHHQNTASAWYDYVVEEKDKFVHSFKQNYDEVVESSENAWQHFSAEAKSALDSAFEQASETADAFGEDLHDTAMDMGDWFEEEVDKLEGHHGRHGRHGRHPRHEPNETVWQLISGSKYTTKLADAIGEYDDLVDALNSTKANYTIFAPTNRAFEKIPEHAHKPSKEVLKAILSYHVVPELYPAGRVLASHTAPTLFKSKHLSSKPVPQRLTFKFTLRGLTVNYYSRIIAANIVGTNGIIHGVDSILLPPPSALTIVEAFPGAYSTLELGLAKTGLLESYNSSKGAGGSFFFPTNNAFQRLGPRINAFLFSDRGLKYLKALLEYHIVPAHTLYSDAYYKPKSDSDEQSIPKGYFHADLPTLLKDRSLAIDIARYGGFITIKINGYSRVAVSDIPADDGVIHVLRNVLIPPKQLAGSEVDQWDGYSEMSVEDLMERLDPYVAKTDL